MEQPLASVLVIDDEEVIRTLLQKSLSLDGFEVEAAVSGEEALDLVRKRRFDLAVTDLKMPGMDGIQTLRALKKADRELQVVVMTGYASLETAIDALKGGAFDYIRKPFKPSEMSALLQRAMERSATEGLIATYGASRVLLASVDHPGLCQTIVDLAQGLFHADGVGLILRRPGGEEREVHWSGDVPASGGALLESLMLHAQRLGRAFCRPSGEGQEQDQLGAGDGFRDVLVYPLTEDGAADMGAICIFRHPASKPFTTGELQRGFLFASESARALTSARLRRRLEEARGEIESLKARLDSGGRAV